MKVYTFGRTSLYLAWEWSREYTANCPWFDSSLGQSYGAFCFIFLEFQFLWLLFHHQYEEADPLNSLSHSLSIVQAVKCTSRKINGIDNANIIKQTTSNKDITIKFTSHLFKLITFLQITICEVEGKNIFKTDENPNFLHWIYCLCFPTTYAKKHDCYFDMCIIPAFNTNNFYEHSFLLFWLLQFIIQFHVYKFVNYIFNCVFFISIDDKITEY